MIIIIIDMSFSVCTYEILYHDERYKAGCLFALLLNLKLLLLNLKNANDFFYAYSKYCNSETGSKVSISKTNKSS